MKLNGFDYAPCARCYRKGALNHVGLCVNCAGIARHNPAQCPDPASCDRCQTATVEHLNRRVPVTQHTFSVGSLDVTLSSGTVEIAERQPAVAPHVQNICIRCGRTGTFLIQYVGTSGRLVRGWYCGNHKPRLGQ
jgi:hypothetical protein